MKRLTVSTAVLALLLGVVGQANAAIIDKGFITADTTTGFQWLDLTETTGRSFNDISAALSSGPLVGNSGATYSGFRYATFKEIETFWTNAGVLNIALTSGGAFNAGAATKNLMELVGITGTAGPDRFDNTFRLTSGITGTAASGFNFLATLTERTSSAGVISYRACIGNANCGTIRPFTADALKGSWLVATPEPGTLLLIGSGLVGLGVGSRRRNRGK